MKFKSSSNFGNSVRSLAISLLIILFSLSLTSFITVFNSGYFLSMFAKEEYYGQAMKRVTIEIASVENELVNPITGAAKVARKDSVLAGTIKWQNIVNDINSVVTEKYKSSESDYNIPVSTYKQNFYDAISKSADEHYVKLSDDDKKVFEEAAQKSVDIYLSYVNFPKITMYTSMLEKVKNFAGVFTIIIIVLLGALSFLHFKKNEWKHRAFRYYIHSISGAGLTLFIAPVVVYSKDLCSQISFSNNATISAFVSGYVLNIFGIIMIFSVVYLLLAFVLSLVVYPKILDKMND